MKKSLNTLKARANEIVTKVNSPKAMISAIALANVAMSTVGVCGKIEETVNTVGGWLFGILSIIGIVITVMGIIGVVQHFNPNNDHGSDQNGLSKGLTKIFIGLFMAFGPTAILALFGTSTKTLGTDFLKGL